MIVCFNHNITPSDCSVGNYVVCCILLQKLAEAAEDADLVHEYNETLQVCHTTSIYIFFTFFTFLFFVIFSVVQEIYSAPTDEEK